MKGVIHPRMMLSDRFSLADMCASPTARKLGLYNLPRDVAEVENLKALCRRILEPISSRLKGRAEILSAYRTQTLNRLMGGAYDGPHVFGQGADFIVDGVPACDAALAIAAQPDLPFDQLQLVHRAFPSGKQSSYLHISHRRLGPNARTVQTLWWDSEGQRLEEGIASPVAGPIEAAA